MSKNIENSIAIFSKQRNYICSCNKSYLSYPALFTHIKRKHNGKVYFIFILIGSWRDYYSKENKENSRDSLIDTNFTSSTCIRVVTIC